MQGDHVETWHVFPDGDSTDDSKLLREMEKNKGAAGGEGCATQSHTTA